MPGKNCLTYFYYFHSVSASLHKAYEAIILSTLVDICMKNKNKVYEMRIVQERKERREKKGKERKRKEKKGKERKRKD